MHALRYVPWPTTEADTATSYVEHDVVWVDAVLALSDVRLQRLHLACFVSGDGPLPNCDNLDRYEMRPLRRLGDGWAIYCVPTGLGIMQDTLLLRDVPEETAAEWVAASSQWIPRRTPVPQRGQ